MGLSLKILSTTPTSGMAIYIPLVLVEFCISAFQVQAEHLCYNMFQYDKLALIMRTLMI